ncbi:MAG: class I SAM-dependent methyltransferase [Halobacteriovoraceae bacterium]|jgi:ubiquinone/menaquinone biosynthesis C-methylase UbiE|nr:class I SAM-dependent methyltransferase [Halobacteriovoraceae bacterium]
MSSYVLESENEIERLDYQSKQRNYLPENEINKEDIVLPKGASVLDAGCGSGLFSRYIADQNLENDINIYAIDSSLKRIEAAKKKYNKSTYSNIFFNVQDLRKLTLKDNSIDIIVCRYVYEHIKDICQEVTDELFRVLKPSGILYVIDADGILYNLDTENKKLNEYLNIIKESDFNYEGNICKKIPRYLQRSGFSKNNIFITPKPMLFFENTDRIYEKKIWDMRFEQIEGLLVPLFGEEGFKEFAELYSLELQNSENFLYYSKFIFKATKVQEGLH